MFVTKCRSNRDLPIGRQDFNFKNNFLIHAVVMISLYLPDKLIFHVKVFYISLGILKGKASPTKITLNLIFSRILVVSFATVAI